MAEKTPDEWRVQLEADLAARQDDVELYTRYYDGDHRLAFATAQFKEAFGDLFEAFATNWCGIVVDVAVERLAVQGVRFFGDEDEDAWTMWNANRLDAGSILAHTEAIKCGSAYVIVGPPRVEGGEPVITAEHPSQVVVATDPADRLRRLAALKKYRDENGDTVCVVYLPDRIVPFSRSTISRVVQAFGLVLPDGLAGEADYDLVLEEDNPIGVVPVVPLENAPNLLTGGASDLKPAISLNDAANKFFSDMIHASEYMAFPQRVMTGVELPRDPVTGEVLEDFQLRAAVGRLWAFEGEEAKVFELPAGSLSNYVEGVDLAVQHLAAQTRTPPHYLLARLVNISGDALKAAETGLVARVRRKHVDFGDGWEETIRLGFAWRSVYGGNAKDKERSETMEAELIWRDPESRNPGAVSDSLIKKQAVGVPWEKLMEEAGYSPQEIRRLEKLKQEEEKVEEEKAARLADQAAKRQPAEPSDRPEKSGGAVPSEPQV
jgi:hypothetical protein